MIKSKFLVALAGVGCWSLAFLLPLQGEVAEAGLSVGEQEVRKHFPAAAFEVTTLRLWPEKVPDELRPIGKEEVGTSGRGNAMIENVTESSVTVVRSKKNEGPRAAVVVCPGGGYRIVGIDEGGVDVMGWLAAKGVVGVYMKYRVPKRNQDFAKHHHPVQDIQRAISLLRSKAADLGIDPERIGVIGFSAGGHLSAMSSTNHGEGQRIYEAIDEVDTVSCRPDFVALVAPAYLTNPILSDQLDPALRPEEVTKKSVPPTFIASAGSDKFTVGAMHWALQLRAKEVPVEVHIYEKGGHAEGIADREENRWWEMYEDWLRRQGVFGE